MPAPPRARPAHLTAAGRARIVSQIVVGGRETADLAGEFGIGADRVRQICQHEIFRHERVIRRAFPALLHPLGPPSRNVIAAARRAYPALPDAAKALIVPGGAL